MGWLPIRLPDDPRWTTTRAQRERLNRLAEIGRTQVYNVQPGSVVAFTDSPNGELWWIEVIEPEPTYRIAYDTGAGEWPLN